MLLTSGAEQDLESIHDSIAGHDNTATTDRVLDRLLKAVDGLPRLPDRGSHPRELVALGTREYRQMVFEPYRLIYRVIGGRVVIYLIADGRRDMQSVLAHRLLHTRPGSS